jgi:hypothetical protein
MSEPALEWETCKHNDLSGSMTLSIVQRHIDDEETIEAIKDDIHSHISGMTMARGKRRSPASYR